MVQTKKAVYLSLLAILGTHVIACKSFQPTSEVKSIPTQVSYETSIAKIMNNYCTSCHSGKRPAGGFALTTYEEVIKKAKEGSLNHRINDGSDPMPPSGLMPKKERMLIVKWIEEGYLLSASQSESKEEEQFSPPELKPIDIKKEGFEFFDLMQGHWVGKMNIMGEKYSWFSFDYRPISPSHVHGIFEGGSMGNLFTSFFIANYKGTQTIMARNGGILNGMYRTSYFMLDKVELGPTKQYFRLVDAYGGKDIMWMELEFKDQSLSFNSYTSRFGLNSPPKQHMKFDATKMHKDVSLDAARKVGYPKNVVEKDFSKGLPMPNWGGEYPVITSASYIYADSNTSLVSLAKLAGDPYRIDEMPYVSTLKVDIQQNEEIKDQTILIYLSKDALTRGDGKFFLEEGYISKTVFDGIFSFPELAPNEKSFTFNYLHPGEYFVTVVADTNKDGYASKGDISSTSMRFSIQAEQNKTIAVKDITIRN